MASFSLIALLATFYLFVLITGAPAPIPVPDAKASETVNAAASSYWLSSISRNGKAAYGNQDYQVFRNVREFGAKGDGILSLVVR